MPRIMLDRWANALPDRKVIEEFWNWLEQKFNEQDECSPRFSDIDMRLQLDEYHDIHEGQLEAERRALILNISTDEK